MQTSPARGTDNANQARLRLRRVGFALIVLGTLDIGVMIYCIIHRISYSSSFNIFAVISGIYVWRGHPWYVRFVPRAAAFFATGFATVLVVLPFLMPLDLSLLELRSHVVEAVTGLVIAMGFIVFLSWVYSELRSEVVIDAYTANELPRSPPKAAFIAGATLVLAIVVLLKLVADSGIEQRAIDLAKTRSGPGFRYWVSSFSTSGDHGRAVVWAYDDRTVTPVAVEW